MNNWGYSKTNHRENLDRADALETFVKAAGDKRRRGIVARFEQIFVVEQTFMDRSNCEG
jgi:hypothetical protein